MKSLRSAGHVATSSPAAPDPKLTARVEALTAELESLKAENQRLTDACQAAQTKDKMEDSMVDELRKIAAESKAHVRDLETELESLHKDNELIAARLDDANAKIAELESKDSESEVTHAQLEEISAQVERFAEVKDKLDHRIAQLKESLQKAQAENESLRETIKSNLFQHAASEKQLREEVDALKAKLAAAPQPSSSPAPKQAKPRQRAAADTDTSDVADVITNTDFLTSAPDPSRFRQKKKSNLATPPRRANPSPTTKPR